MNDTNSENMAQNSTVIDNAVVDNALVNKIVPNNKVADSAVPKVAGISNRVWVITGASSGFGLALTRAALNAGERVLGTGRDMSKFADLQESFGNCFIAVQHDVRDTDAVHKVIDRAVADFGRIDVLVNNAGVGQVGTAEEVTDAQLKDMLAQHLFGPAALVRAALPYMRKAGSGSIVQMSSQGGRGSFPAVGSYSAGKFALEGWSEALAAEVKVFGIKVLIVEPSRFRTEFNSSDVLLKADENAEYDSVVADIRADMLGSDGKQEGDPDRAATVIRRVINDQDAPLRLPLGAEAVRNLKRIYGDNLASAERWAELSQSADFPGIAPSSRPGR
ncbi:SDR family oxidoreductase [Bifidobacterium sp.]|jgi:NAD(P)-dependent dehydrogenase (short-subunit alcohol dehydrogenase family)|uniref:SDR family oxidoreductase n=1 Tax=Bifidobacterium sp. TaxID=41200 RepID=UPI0025C05CD3|nr:SDR family oxidoreductase [Bifidobacterium sp.]MCI1635516.1 SDR family oxidoreductase [Bifidobacterium sp.]